MPFNCLAFTVKVKILHDANRTTKFYVRFIWLWLTDKLSWLFNSILQKYFMFCWVFFPTLITTWSLDLPVNQMQTTRTSQPKVFFNFIIDTLPWDEHMELFMVPNRPQSKLLLNDKWETKKLQSYFFSLPFQRHNLAWHDLVSFLWCRLAY